MIAKLFRNWPIKLLSILLAVIVWFIIMSMADPSETRSYFNIPVQLLNQDLLTKAGKSYTLEGGDSPTVNIRVNAAGSVHRELSSSDFTATADVAKMFDVTGRVPIEVSCNRSSLSSRISSISLITDTLKINFEDVVTKEFNVQILLKGELAEGYFVSRQWTNPANIRISAPASVIDRIQTVQTVVDVNGLKDSTVVENNPLQFLSGTGQILTLDNMRDTTISADSVSVGLDIFTMKTLPVIISQEALDKVKAQVPDGYRYIKAQQTIVSVQVKGLMSRLADIAMISIPETALNLRGAKESRTFVLDLNDYLPAGIELMDDQENRITITLEVVELDVREYQIGNLRVSGMDENYRYQFDRTVTVYIRALDTDFVEFNPATVSVSLDLGEYATMEGVHKLEVTVSCSDSVFTPLLHKTFADITVVKYEPPTSATAEPEPPTDEDGNRIPGPEETLPAEDDDSIGA